MAANLPSVFAELALLDAQDAARNVGFAHAQHIAWTLAGEVCEPQSELQWPHRALHHR